MGMHQFSMKRCAFCSGRTGSSFEVGSAALLDANIETCKTVCYEAYQDSSLCYKNGIAIAAQHQAYFSLPTHSTSSS